MPDFTQIVLKKLGSLPLDPDRSAEIVAELAHQLEDKVQEGIERGLPEARALAEALDQFGDWDTVRRGIVCAEMGESVMWPQRSAISRRASWAALAVVVLLCLAPDFRQTLRAAAGAWSQDPPALSDNTLRNVAERGLKEHDASLVAFAALHLMEWPAATRYAEQAVAMDPAFTWIGARFVSRSDPRVDTKPWAQRLVAWDPDNAVPQLFVADQIYREKIPAVFGSIYDAPIASVADTTGWGAKMRAAIAAPRYDNYRQRRFELDRSVLERLQGARTDALVWYSAQMEGTPDQMALWAYAGLVTRKLGPDAERAGNDTEATNLYLNLARFAERMEKGSAWAGDHMAAWKLQTDAFASLASLAERSGNKGEAAAYGLLREQAQSSRAALAQTWRSTSRSGWESARASSHLAWTAASVALLAGIACLGWIATLGFRSEDRVLKGWPGSVALGLSYAPVVFLAASAMAYAAMQPYLRSPHDFNSSQDIFSGLAPFWFGFWGGGWEIFGWGPQFYMREMMGSILLAVAVLVTGIALLRWVARNRAGHTPQAG